MTSFIVSVFALASLILSTNAQTGTIVDLVSRDPNLLLLKDAVVAGGLVETLSGAGPFTVFAPTNEAFTALGPLLGWALNPHNKQDLDNILTYHVVSGKVLSTDLKDGEVVPTLDGLNNLTVHISSSGAVTINSSPVLKANVLATNGVVHVIGSSVLVPANSGAPIDNVVQLAVGDADLSTLVKCVVAANVTGPLSTLAPITVFAPTNEAFAKLPTSILNQLLSNPKELEAVLLYHVVGNARIYSDEIPPFVVERTLNGESIVIRSDSRGVVVNDVAKVVQANVDGVNGVVHLIDTVLIPPAFAF